MASLFQTAAEKVASSNLFTPQTQEFDESKGVAGRVASITGSGSSLMQLAETQARQRANAAGLRGSSTAVGAAQNAVIGAATPIAQADAQLFQSQALTNQNAVNTARGQNAQLGTSAGLTGLQLDAQGQQQDKTLAMNQQQLDVQKDQFAKQLGLSTQDLDLRRDQLSQSNKEFLAGLDLQQQQLNAQKDQFGSTQAQNLSMFNQELAQKGTQFQATQAQQMALAQMDATNRKEIAAIEASYRNDIQGSQNISGAWGTMMTNIQAVQNNPNLDAAAKSTMIQNAMDQFSAFANFWKKSTGGTADVSDLLNFGAPAPAAAPAPATAQAGGSGGLVKPGATAAAASPSPQPAATNFPGLTNSAAAAAGTSGVAAIQAATAPKPSATPGYTSSGALAQPGQPGYDPIVYMNAMNTGT